MSTLQTHKRASLAGTRAHTLLVPVLPGAHWSHGGPHAEPRAGHRHRPSTVGPGRLRVLEAWGAPGAGGRAIRRQVFASGAQISSQPMLGSHDRSGGGQSPCLEPVAGRDLGRRGGRAGQARPPPRTGAPWSGERRWGSRHPSVSAPPGSSEGLTQSFWPSPGQSHGAHERSSWELRAYSTDSTFQKVLG